MTNTPPNMSYCRTGLHWVSPSAIVARPGRNSCIHCKATIAAAIKASRLKDIRAAARQARKDKA